MPIYEYRCSGCGEGFEVLVRSMSAAGKEKCPSCGAGGCERLMSVFAAQGTARKVSGGGCGGCTSNNCSSCGR